MISCRTLPDPQTLPPVPSERSAGEPVVETATPDEVAVVEPLPLEDLGPEVLRVTERPTPILVRVGLQTDQVQLDLRCCGMLRAHWEGRTFLEARRLTVRADPKRATVPVFHLQVAALRDPQQAEATVERLRAATGFGASTFLDAESGLHKVKVGPFDSREVADAAKRTLAAQGVEGAWVLVEGGVIEDPAIEVRSGQQVIRTRGRWLAIGAGSGEGIRVDGTRYRGRVLLYLNDRGSLNVIDELSIEEYLRGVVPKELGPDLYPQIEALKAQTVAARTYTVRNLGEFSNEGFDICATPRCQVYGGMDVEHALTDRAIVETAGEVLLWNDEPIDALYSATCGGHTENVGTVFPLKRDELYLKGIPCVEHGGSRLDGRVPPPGFPAVLLRELGATPTAVAPRPQDTLQPLAVQLDGLLRQLGRSPRPSSPLGNRSREAVERFWTDLGGEGKDLPFSRGQERLEHGDESQFLWELAVRIGVFESAAATFAAVDDGTLHVRRAFGGDEVLAVTPQTVVARRAGDGWIGGPLSLAPGDALRLIRRGDDLVAVVQEATHPEAVFDRVSRWRQWRRFRTDRELRMSVAEQLPGFEYASFEPLERGVSGRVGRMRLTATDGREEILEGLAVRWALDLPDTRFTARRTKPEGKSAGWLFSGQGWGHGVGMCQIGAYGMAQRGNGYRSILSHYYSGVQLGRVSAVSRRVEQQTR